MIEIRPATPERFHDVATLVGPATPGASACWCLSPRLTSGELAALDPGERAGVARGLCGRDPAPGVLAYDGERAVGWASAGPHAAYGRLSRSRTLPPPGDPAATWVAPCFVVRTGHRGQGVAGHLLEGVVELARAHGASAVEGYPVDNDGQRVSAVLAYVGTRALFERHGFALVGPTTSRSGGRPRVVVRLEL